MNVREYFEAAFPDFQYAQDRDPKDLESMPLDSHCGDDCKKAIDAARAFALCVLMAFGDDKLKAIHDIGLTCVMVCGCFICG